MDHPKLKLCIFGKNSAAPVIKQFEYYSSIFSINEILDYHGQAILPYDDIAQLNLSQCGSLTWKDPLTGHFKLVYGPVSAIVLLEGSVFTLNIEKLKEDEETYGFPQLLTFPINIAEKCVIGTTALYILDLKYENNKFVKDSGELKSIGMTIFK